MARIMTLDGIDQVHLGEIRTRLGQAELSWWTRPVGLEGLLDPITGHPLWILGGLIAGLLLGAKFIHPRSR